MGEVVKVVVFTQVVVSPPPLSLLRLKVSPALNTLGRRGSLGVCLGRPEFDKASVTKLQEILDKKK